MTEYPDTQNESNEPQQFNWRLLLPKLKVAGWMIVAVSLVYCFYSLGHYRSNKLTQALQSALEQAQTENTALATEAQEARAQAALLELQYAEDAPHGATQQIMALVKERLENGVSPDRVAFLVAMARNDPDCEQATDNRRFLIQTPLTKGANSAVSFSNDTITVTGQGLPSRDENNDLQTWFDPAQNVEILFTVIGGQAHQREGKLPLHYSMTTGDTEHRFTIKTGQNRGFVVVTEQRCSFP